MCLAVPGKILSIDTDGEITRAGRVDFAGIVRDVNLSCVPEAEVDDYVLVHAGVAIARLDESEALRTLHLLYEMANSGEDVSEVP